MGPEDITPNNPVDGLLRRHSPRFGGSRSHHDRLLGTDLCQSTVGIDAPLRRLEAPEPLRHLQEYFCNYTRYDPFCGLVDCRTGEYLPIWGSVVPQ